MPRLFVCGRGKKQKALWGVVFVILWGRARLHIHHFRQGGAVFAGGRPHIGKGVGIGLKAPPLDDDSRLMTKRERLDRALPFATASFNMGTMLAVLEHLS